MSEFSNPAGRSGDDALAYTRALFALLGDRDPMAVVAELPEWIAARFRGLDEARARRPEAPGKWAPVQVLAHLLDAEIEHGHRTRHIAGGGTPPIQPYDQDGWAREFDYATVDVETTLAALVALRRANLAHWRRLTPAQLERHGIHAERGPESTAHYLKLTAGHDLVHRRQLDRMLSA